MIPNEKPVTPPEGQKAPLSPVEEALAMQAARRPPRGLAKRMPPIAVTPKVKRGRKNRRKIPK